MSITYHRTSFQFDQAIYKAKSSQRKIELASPEVVRRYVKDLRQFIDSSELVERRAFIKSFVKEIKVMGDEGRIRYTFPIPPDNLDEERLRVLPIVRYKTRTYCVKSNL